MSHNAVSRYSEDTAADVENSTASQLQRTITPGGHQIDFSEPPFPPSHRKFANPGPTGLLSFGTGFFVASLFMLYGKQPVSLST